MYVSKIYPAKQNSMIENQTLLKSLCDLEIPTVVQLAPDGERVFYSTGLTWSHCSGKHPDSTLWLARTGTANSAKQITSGSFKDYAPAWNPNGESIAFLSDRAQVGEKWVIYILPTSEGV